MTSPIVLILGAGANIGANVAQSFASKGFKVVAASRTIKPDFADSSATLTIQGDLTDPSVISSVFATTKAKVGVPSTIVYNLASIGSFDTAGPPKEFADSLNANVVSLWAAIQEAVVGFDTLPKEVKKTLIYTGNALNQYPMPFMAMLGAGKAAAASLIQVAEQKYKDQGYRFFYADERGADGSMAGMSVNPKAHGVFYPALAEQKTETPWLATFVGGKGYVDFSHK